jgi:threonine/homoserine/homoserine lactone efflux protein
MLTFTLAGIVLGLSAGFSPGPLTALVISETIRHGTKAGMKVGLAPVICDAPIILFTVFVISKFSNINIILAGVSFLGAVYVAYLGYKNWHTQPLAISILVVKDNSLQKGIIVNFLNPHPYIFWLTVGAPTLVKAAPLGWPAPVSFLLFFYVLHVGSKIFIAYVAGTSRRFFSGKYYILLNRTMGVLLMLFAILLVKDGIHLLIN